MRPLRDASRWITCLLLVGSMPLAVHPAQAAPTHRHALLIGISVYDHYNRSGLFPNLSCKEDVRRIKAALVHTFKFDPDPAHKEIVELIEPSQTTRDQIEAALTKLARDAADGDLIYIHYSGHGSQLPDSTKPTGLDDAIVPSDYKDNESNEITGRWLGKYVKDLKSNHPNSELVLSFDCCHSGTVTRGSARKRGIDYKEYVAWYEAHYHVKPPAPQPNPAARSAATRGAQGAITDLNGAGYVVLSACTNEQSASEMTDGDVDMGRLSYCLSRVLSAATPRTTYREVFDEVRAMFRSRFSDQSPQLDGNANTYLLGGTATEPPTSILVNPAEGGGYQLDAGKLQGMTVGSVFAIYAKDAEEFKPETQIAEARIKSVQIAASVLELTRRIKADLQAADLTAAHAVELEHNYGRPPLALDAVSVRRVASANADAILTKLTNPEAPLRMVRTELAPGEKPDIAMARVPAEAFVAGDEAERPAARRGAQVLALVRSDTGAPILPVDETRDIPSQVFSGLQKVARYQYAASLGEDQASLNRVDRLRIRLVPCEPPAKDADGNPIFSRDRTAAPDTPLHVNDYFTVEVQNAGPHSLHLAVLDLESNADVSVAWPDAESTVEDNVIKPTGANSWVKLWVGSDTTRHAVYQCGSTDPHEIYKAIATKDYVNFNILRTRGKDRGPDSPFSDLFGPGLDGGERGPTLVTRVQSASWTAADCVFQVAK